MSKDWALLKLYVNETNLYCQLCDVTSKIRPQPFRLQSFTFRGDCRLIPVI